MKNAIIAAVAGLAATAAAAGQAIVNNQCDYDVHINFVPCSGSASGVSTLKAGSQNQTTYDSCPGGCGWSIKIGTEESLSGDILQYEYTYVDDGADLWYDMSLVNVNALEDYDVTFWNATLDDNQTLPAKKAPIPWSFSTESDAACTPLQRPYNYPDDNAGSQCCHDPSVSITVNLCPAGSSSGSSASSSVAASSASSTQLSSYSAPATSSSSASAVQTTFATSTSATPSSSSSAASSSSSGGYGHSWGGVIKEADVQAQTTAITTSSASVTTSTAADGNVATEVVVDYVTEIATAYVTERDAQPTPAVHRRHTHGHPHGPHHA